MPEYLSPGVYIEEIDAGPKPIAGVGTSTAGAVGVTYRGPTSGKPKLVTSFADFERQFGGFLPEPEPGLLAQWTTSDDGGHWWRFAMSVKGFFDNGGQRVYIKRVFAENASSSVGKVDKGLVLTLGKDADKAATSIVLQSLIGVHQGVGIKLFRGDTGNEVVGPFKVTGYDSTTRTATLDTALPEGLKAGRDFAEVHARANGPTVSFTARDKGAWANELRVHTRPMVGSVYTALPDPGAGPLIATGVSGDHAAASTTITVADDTGFAVGDHVMIDGVEYAVTSLPTGSKLKLDPPFAQAVANGTVVKRLRIAANAGQPKINLWGGRHVYVGAIIELDNGVNKDIGTVTAVGPDDLITVSANLTKAYYEGHKARVIEAEVIVEHTKGLVAPETFSNLRLVPGSPSSLVENVNLVSKLVTASAQSGYSASDLAQFPTANTGAWAPFANGDDKLSELTVDDFVGKDGGSNNRTGIVALEDIDEVAICFAPNMWAGGIHAMLIQHCEILKDRFAILDPRDGLSMEGIQAFRAPIDTKYAALYYPWLNVRDTVAKKTVHVAPSGHLAGIYAQTDVDRGVHKAPANTVVRGITLKDGFAQDITKREQDILNPKGINALRFFPGRGHRVWGARVLTSDSAWKYINVRRLFIMIEESIDEGTQWVVFEPNDRPLWARVRQTITNFLTTQWRNGALQGKTADEAFFVRCDESTMTQDDIDNGRLICEIGIAPVKPAEFVIFRIQQKTLELQG